MNSDVSFSLNVEVVIGCKFIYTFFRGKRVMGWCSKGAMSNLLMADRRLLYPVPEEWTMEEAATVPVYYTMAIYALITVIFYKYQFLFIMNSILYYLEKCDP